jgi:hypothetical protein
MRLLIYDGTSAMGKYDMDIGHAADIVMSFRCLISGTVCFRRILFPPGFN